MQTQHNTRIQPEYQIFMDVRHLGFLEIPVTFKPFEIILPFWIYIMIKKFTFWLNSGIVVSLHTNLVGLSQTVQKLQA